MEIKFKIVRKRVTHVTVKVDRWLVPIWRWKRPNSWGLKDVLPVALFKHTFHWRHHVMNQKAVKKDLLLTISCLFVGNNGTKMHHREVMVNQPLELLHKLPTICHWPRQVLKLGQLFSTDALFRKDSHASFDRSLSFQATRVRNRRLCGRHPQQWQKHL